MTDERLDEILAHMDVTQNVIGRGTVRELVAALREARSERDGFMMKVKELELLRSMWKERAEIAEEERDSVASDCIDETNAIIAERDRYREALQQIIAEDNEPGHGWPSDIARKALSGDKP